MKTKLYLLAFCIVFLFADSLAQITLILRPGAETGKDAIIASCVPCGYNNMNGGSFAEFFACAWTNGGHESNGRSLIEFDLTAIPANSTIIKAILSLYYNPESSNGSHSSLSGSNASLLKRITEPWLENVVTWDNQPATTDTNEVTLPASITFYQNYPSIDVTDLVTDMIKFPTRGFGFMFKVAYEEYYRRMIFASSDHPDTTLHPKLEITYKSGLVFQEPGANESIRLFPNPNEGRFTISSPGNFIYSVDVYDGYGARVYHEKVKSENEEINLFNLPKGIYFVRMVLEKGIVTKKVSIY